MNYQSVLLINPRSVTPAFDHGLMSYFREKKISSCYVGSYTRYNQSFLNAIGQSGTDVILFLISSSVASPIVTVFNYIRLMIFVLLSSPKYDRVIISFPGILIVDFFVFLILRKKTVFLLHNAEPHDRGRVIFRDRVFCFLAKEIWCPSVYSKNEILNKISRNYDCKLRVIQHGLIPAIPNDLELDFVRTEKPSADRERLRFSIIGNVKPYKGVNIFLEQIGKLEDINLSIYGEWDRSLSSLLLDIRENGIHTVNRFLSEEEYREAILSSDVIVLPHLHASQSGIFYNCLYYGIKPLVSDCGEAARILRSFKLEKLIFNPRDRESFYAAVRYVVENDADVVRKLNALKKSISFDLSEFHSSDFLQKNLEN